MSKARPGMILTVLAFLAVTALSQLALESYVDARAGGGRSGGFRGSRSTQAPSRPSQVSPSQQRDATPPPSQAAPMASQPGGFMRGLGGGLLGGFLGAMLFSSFAHAGMGGFGGSGIGLVEILLFAGLGYFIYRRFFRSAAAAPGFGPMQYQSAGYETAGSATAREAVSAHAPDFGSTMMMDRSFDPARFLKSAQELFFKIQGAWNRQDAAALGSLCGPELMRAWEQELAELRARGQRNRMENIALSSSAITETWTEKGQDYITVRLLANLLDYTVDEKSGAVVAGSNSEPVEFEEFWTFSRPVGNNPWKLSAVQQA
jgi:predicted lipid-binding transport protein (Tim44 family)